jgi:hypothetical protein
MNFLEKDLEQIIYETPVMELQDRGLDVSGKPYRQLRIGNYGIADLVYVNKEYYINGDLQKLQYPVLIINVLEIKKDKIGISSFLQAIKYCQGIKRYLEEYRNFRRCFCQKFCKSYKNNNRRSFLSQSGEQITYHLTC